MTQRLRQRVKALIPEDLVVRTLPDPPGHRLLLTFDDGPNPDVTPQVLERLAAANAKAVFFVVGKLVDGAPGVLPAIERGGHVIGNHTYRHRNDRDPYLLAYYRDLQRCQAAIGRHARKPRWFRPPKGHLSVTSLGASRALGLRTMNWSLNVRDWACKSRDEALAAAAQFDAQVQPGHIALLHDGNRYVLDLLDYVLPRLQARGFDLHSAIDSLPAS